MVETGWHSSETRSHSRQHPRSLSVDPLDDLVAQIPISHNCLAWSVLLEARQESMGECAVRCAVDSLLCGHLMTFAGCHQRESVRVDGPGHFQLPIAAARFDSGLCDCLFVGGKVGDVRPAFWSSNVFTSPPGAARVAAVEDDNGPNLLLVEPFQPLVQLPSSHCRLSAAKVHRHQGWVCQPPGRGFARRLQPCPMPREVKKEEVTRTSLLSQCRIPS
ncbi:uncharacterized protein B0I36DRAFT_47078 [Microdochium trichocladiopsis]|uniref:Uncharacterized protein n=1 Tax=Microdochium trichocladiopsis TaxID=1682393 RepID=A0A9P9BMJ4_9PEZI|nr:uncharacterized protein B0I36DRAFT_47078 [Microdochium trichocladiopsis]KAH7016510.1 hypothetical protein B0I36DRAFT_47078 [Microdochium trichocladiopsis]